MVLSFDILDLVSVYLRYFYSTCQRRFEHAQALFVPLSYCRPESDFLTTIVLLSVDPDRIYVLCLSYLLTYD